MHLVNDVTELATTVSDAWVKIKHNKKLNKQSENRNIQTKRKAKELADGFCLKEEMMSITEYKHIQNLHLITYKQMNTTKTYPNWKMNINIFD